MAWKHKCCDFVLQQNNQNLLFNLLKMQVVKYMTELKIVCTELEYMLH